MIKIPSYRKKRLTKWLRTAWLAATLTWLRPRTASSASPGQGQPDLSRHRPPLAGNPLY